MYLSKSKFCRGVQCPKMLWMDRNKSEEADNSVTNEAVLTTGNIVGDLAMGYFGDYIEVPYETEKSKMLKQTEQLIKQRVPNICEASFSFKNQFCSVDILRVHEDYVDIVEVKSSTSVHDIYYYDMAYQYYVLTGCGLKVHHVYNLHINSDYIRQGNLNFQALFTLEDCTEHCLSLQQEVIEKIATIEKISMGEEEPLDDISERCFTPYSCVYWKYCSKHVKSPSVFDISRLQLKKKFSLYRDGIITYEDVIKGNPKLSDKQFRQVETEYYDLPKTINTEEIKRFLDTLTYPLYYLDFETFQQAIPEYDGISPYSQIPFQYSLHRQETINGQLAHMEFLGEEGTDPRRKLAEQLVKDIPKDVCTLAYNMGFEKGVIRKLAANYPDLSDHLMNIHDHIKDLMIPFQRQAVYCKELCGSYSIKWVLPAMCPNDPELDYHVLEGIHNGSEAMNAFAELPNHTTKEVKEIRKNLLKYCCLDTLAMVKIVEKLYELGGK